MKQLKMGALSRTTGATNMNATSSRSHAIFTLHVKQIRVVPVDAMDGCPESTQQEFETLTAKFHFVDLAGSERLKRTGATGDRAKEGISINCGLLALGNVIAALGDKTKKSHHVPYRDSKLTRLLQDSLGGNSCTLMIACISPSDRDFVETLNTLRYANRAKNIKNRVIANQDKSSQTIAVLRRQIQQLELELMEYKQGKRGVTADGNEAMTDAYHENKLLNQELAGLRTRCKVLQETNDQANKRIMELVSQKELAKWTTADGSNDVAGIVSKYMAEIESLRVKLIEAEALCSELRRQNKMRQSMSPYHAMSAVPFSGNYDIRPNPEVDVDEVLEVARREVEREKKALRKDLFHSKSEKDGLEDTNGNEMMNGEDAAAADEMSDSDSDETEQREGEAAAARAALLEITDEITIKERLIIELEKNQNKLMNMRKHYEEKLLQLTDKIRDIEKERDDVLSKLNHATNPTEESKKRSREFQAQITSLQVEMKKMSNAKLEHDRNMKNNQRFEMQARQLRNEVETMKRTKVRLLQQLKEEQQKHRDDGMRYNKRIAQLSKQERLKDVRIRSLETANTRYQDLLKRKDQEVNALKKRSKPAMSEKVAGRVKRPLPVARSDHFSPRAAKHKWDALERNINRYVVTKTTITKNENQMDRYMQERTAMINSLSKCKSKLERAVKGRQSHAIIQALNEEMEGIQHNIDYYTQSIRDCQSVIMQLEEDLIGMDDLTQDVNPGQDDEMKYLLQRALAVSLFTAHDVHLITLISHSISSLTRRS
jgi:kinesin family protein 4/21/27